jgi:DNA invertase Pin-like site-specific DNA recombinase
MAMKRLSKPESTDARLIGYARVSTMEQRPDLQTDALTRAGVLLDDTFIEKLSGASRKRPQLDLAIKSLQAGDTFIVWRLDRLARSMRDLLQRIEAIEGQGATLRSLTESFDTKTAGGRFLVYVLGAVAELERQLTIERTQAGMKARAERGFEVGRPAKMTPKHLDAAEALLKKGTRAARVARKYNVAVSTIYANFQISRDGDKIVVKRRKK